MENNEPISVVRDTLISVSQALIDYSKVDFINKIQIESKALKKLRHPSRASQIRPYARKKDK